MNLTLASVFVGPSKKMVMMLLAAASLLICAPSHGGLSAYYESPYDNESDGGQAHYAVIGHKCGSGCFDAALLFISYEGIRFVEPSLADKIMKDLLSKEKQDLIHFGILFDSWDMPNRRFYLKADLHRPNDENYSSFDKRIVYDLKTRKVAFVEMKPKVTEE